MILTTTTFVYVPYFFDPSGVDFTRLCGQAKSCRSLAFGKKRNSISPKIRQHRNPQLQAEFCVPFAKSMCHLPNLFAICQTPFAKKGFSFCLHEKAVRVC